MGRKKRKLDLELKPFCYYCDREFSDEKVLLQHQKAKHFKCLICDRKLDLANSLAVHMMQVHKSNLKAVPNSLPKRSNPELNIRGMNGVPTELIEDNLNKLKQKINALNIKRQQKVNNSFKKQRVPPIMDSQYFPYCSPPNYYPSPYMYPNQQNNMVQYPESFSNVSLSAVPNASNMPHVPNEMTTSSTKNKNTENVTNYLPTTKEMNTTNGNITTKNDQRGVNGNNEKTNENESEIDISKEKHLSSATRSELKLNETYISNSISNEELSKSEEKITLTLMDPLNIFEDLPFKLPMFSSNASKIMQNEENNISSSFLPPLIPSNKMEISTNSFTKTNTVIDNATTTNTTNNNNKENTVTNNVTTSGISSVPPPPPFPPGTTAPPSVSLTTHNPSVTSGRYVPFIPPPPTTPPTNSHLQPSPYMPTVTHLPTPPPPPSLPLISPLPGVSQVSSLPTALKIPPTPSGLLTSATTSTSPFFLPPTITSTNTTSNNMHSEFSTAPNFSNDNAFQAPLSQEAKELNMLHMNNGDICNQTIIPNRGRTKELLQGCNELDTKDITTYCYNNSKTQHIQLNLPRPTDMTTPHIEGLTLFYNEQDFVYRVKAVREFGWSGEGTVEKRC